MHAVAPRIVLQSNGGAASSGYDRHHSQHAPASAMMTPVVDASRAVLWRPAAIGFSGHSKPSLYWAPHSRCPLGEGVIAYSTEDKPEFAYEAFNEGRDFGPLDIARTVMYCHWVDALCQAHAGCTALVHLSSDVSAEERANAVVLCCAYLILAQGMSAEAAFRPFADEQLTPFLDCRGEHVSGSAIGDESDIEFELSAMDVLSGLERARDLSWLDYRTFGVEDHASMLRPEHGDMSWLIPGRALALASPWAEPQDQDGLPVCTPALLWRYFSQHGVNMIVQCNDPDREEEGDRRRLLMYEARAFDEVGIRHVRLAFEDGGCPSIEIVLKFLETVKANNGNYAVHCRSGLGRTATLIGVYAMENFGFNARSFIGWARVMRPGTVHGSQQQYLVNLEQHVKPGSPWPLESLDQRERLQLLPRRELRFWALDSGIAAGGTRMLSDADIVERILAAHGLHVPLPQVPTREPPPLRPQVNNSVLYARPANAVNEVAAGGVPVPSGLTGLNAAIASLNRGIGSAGAAVLSEQSANISAQKISAGGGGGGSSKLDEWDEVLRYVHLLAAVQADSAPSWERVQRRIERLRDKCGVESKENVSFSGHVETAALDQVREARRLAALEVENHEAELAKSLQEARDLHRECEQLRQQLAIEREDRISERKRLDEQGEAAATNLRHDELRLERAVREVEELRGRVLRQGGLEPWRVERVERLRNQIAEAKEAAARHSDKCQEQRARLNSARSEQQRILVDDRSEGALDSAGLASRSFAEAEARGAASAAAALHKARAAGSQDDEVPWDSARKSIEQLRDRFQLAVQQARQTIAAS